MVYVELIILDDSLNMIEIKLYYTFEMKIYRDKGEERKTP